MSNYEAKVIKYCRERILPWNYKINKELKEKLIQLAEDAVLNYNDFSPDFKYEVQFMREEGVLFCIGEDVIDEWIGQACVNAGYLTKDDKIFLLKSFLRRTIENNVHEGFGHILSHPSIAYQLCTNYLLEEGRENLSQEHFLYLLMEDRQSPNDAYIHNFRTVLRDRNLNDLDKILYYLCLPRIIDKSAKEPLLQEATSLIFESGISKENKLRLFEQLLENNTFLMLFRISQREVEKKEMRAYLSNHFLGTLLEHLRGLPEKIRAQVGYNLMRTNDRDLNSVMRPASKCYILQSATEEEKRASIVKILTGIDKIKSEGEKYAKLGAYEALYTVSKEKEFEQDFVRKMLEQGLLSNSQDVRAQCYKYLFLLFEDVDYVEMSLSDTSKKVRETVVRTALSGEKMDVETRSRLYAMIKERGLEITERQESRLKNLLERGE